MHVPGFINNLNILRSKINCDKKFVTLMSKGSLAVKLVEPGIFQILDELIILLEDKFITSMCNGVVSRLLKPGYVTNLKIWISKLGKDTFATFVLHNAELIETESNFPILDQWRERVTHLKFWTFMCGGIGKYLLEQNRNEEILQWFDVLELQHFCTIFGNPTFVSRVVKGNQFSKLWEIYNYGGANKSKDMYTRLSGKKWIGLKELFPK